MPRTAILFIHGILGTPEHFRPFLSLVPENWTVRNLLLAGHGGGVREFSRASMKEWKTQVSDALCELRQTHERIVIAAHSMGTLFAIQQEINADALFLLNVPLRLRLRRRMLTNLWRVYRGRIPGNDVWAQAARDACGVAHDANLLCYLGWVPRYLELFREIRRTRRLLVSVPAHVWLSRLDEMVSVRSAALLEKNPAVQVHILEHSGHYYYAPEDLALLREDFSSFLED